jgi:ABC-type multidrug transport system fused ATPase/permease subunit
MYNVQSLCLQENSVGTLGSRLAVDAGRIQSLFSQQLGNMSAVVGCLIAGLATSFWASWIMALTLYSLLPLFALAGILNYKVGQLIPMARILTVIGT